MDSDIMLFKKELNLLDVGLSILRKRNKQIL